MSQWYYGDNGQQSGPVDDEGIRRAISDGLLTPMTMVWREGMLNWLPLSQVPELAGGAIVPGYSGYPGGPGGPPAYYPQQATSGLAIASMVCGIAGFLMCYVWAIPGIAAVICGHMAMARIRDSPIPVGGRGMALAGLILGYILILMSVGIAIVFFSVFAAAGHGHHPI